MRFDRALTLAAALLALVGGEVCAQATSKHAPAGQPGLKVGERAPDFTLRDQAGKERPLAEFLGKGKVALVFYRSADW